MTSNRMGRRWPSKAVDGDTRARCDYCGARWLRSEMFRDRASMLTCPDCEGGLPAIVLDEMNARSSDGRRPGSVQEGGGNYDMDFPAAVQVTSSLQAGFGPGLGHENVDEETDGGVTWRGVQVTFRGADVTWGQ